MYLDLGEHSVLHHPNHFNLWPDYYFNYYYYCQCYMEGEKNPIQECGELLIMHDCN